MVSVDTMCLERVSEENSLFGDELEVKWRTYRASMEMGLASTDMVMAVSGPMGLACLDPHKDTVTE